jgi:uncharacterized protein with gpF-like domain
MAAGDEVARQLALQDKIQAEMEPKLFALFARAYSKAADRYEVSGNPLPDEGLRREVDDVLRDAWAEVIRGSGRDVIDQFKDGYSHLEVKADGETLFDRILQEFIEQFGALKVQQITDATREHIRRFIASGSRRGLGVAAIAKEMRDAIPDLSALRANRIARTETHTASQFSQVAVARESRRPLLKVWNSVEDHRTRDFGEGDGVSDGYNHRVMDEVSVAMDDTFMVPTKYGYSEPLMQPGDPRGSAGNVINCRCAVTFKRGSENG